jgi:hypothetical protein
MEKKRLIDKKAVLLIVPGPLMREFDRYCSRYQNTRVSLILKLMDDFVKKEGLNAEKTIDRIQ